jgi:single-stranded-DNA-specific exonuclease
MRYKLIGNNDFLVDPVETILNNRGVTNHELFLNPDDSMVYDYKLLKNIDKAVECCVKHIKNNSHIFILPDCDADGMTSASIIYNYLKRINKSNKSINLSFEIHSGKEHGLKPIIDKIPNDVKLVIVPDAGSSDFAEHKILFEKNIDVIVLDHHECEKYSEHAIVVNNQLCDYPNKTLSGAGISYKFCLALDSILNVNYANDYLDLMAVGLIGDMMDTRELETRYYITKGMKQIRNPFIKALIDKQAFSMKNLINMVSIAFYVVPLINACIRFGSQEEKINMFHAFINSDITIPYQPKAIKGKKQPEVIQPIYEAMARICVNVKARQDNAKKKGIETLEKRIAEKNLLYNKILIINGSGIIEPTLTGLVANDLTYKHKRPVIILKHFKSNLYGGSARGYEKSELKDFRSFLWDTECFESVEGHKNSFGIKIKKSEIVRMNKIANEKLKNIKFENINEVDFIIKANKLVSKIIIEIDSLKYIWGQGVEEPLLAITELNLSRDDIKLIGVKKNTIKFLYRNIEFVLFNTNETYYNELTENAVINVTVIGKCAINEYAGSKTAQIVIKDLSFDIDETENLGSW